MNAPCYVYAHIILLQSYNILLHTLDMHELIFIQFLIEKYFTHDRIQNGLHSICNVVTQPMERFISDSSGHHDY
jgi:hypothetical protein